MPWKGQGYFKYFQPVAVYGTRQRLWISPWSREVSRKASSPLTDPTSSPPFHDPLTPTRHPTHRCAFTILEQNFLATCPVLSVFAFWATPSLNLPPLCFCGGQPPVLPRLCSLLPYILCGLLLLTCLMKRSFTLSSKLFPSPALCAQGVPHTPTLPYTPTTPDPCLH